MADITKEVENERERFANAAKRAGLHFRSLTGRIEDDDLRDAPGILIEGAPGTGKTYSSRTCPEPLLFIDLEGGSQGAKMQAILRKKDADIIRIPSDFPQSKIPFLDSAGNLLKKAVDAKAWDALMTTLDLIYASPTLHGYNFIFIDSITAAADAALTKVLKQAKRTMPQLQEWGEQVAMLKGELIFRIRELRTFKPNRRCVPVACVAHLKETTIGDATYYGPLVTGKLSSEIGRFFPEEYFSTVDFEQAGTVVNYRWYPRHPYAEAKSTWGLTEPMEQDFGKVISHIAKIREALEKEKK